MQKRFAIIEVMTLILLSAVDSWATRSIFYHEGGATDALLSTAGALVFNVLVVSMLSLRRSLRRGEPAPFLVAFEAVGGSCFLIYTLAAVFSPDLLLRHFKGLWAPYIRYMASSSIGMTRYFGLSLELALMVHFAMILLVPATIAGLCARGRKMNRSRGDGRVKPMSETRPDQAAGPEPLSQRVYAVAGLSVV